VDAEDLRAIAPAPRLRGELRLPGDKSVSHRALMLALVAEGESRILAAGDGADVRSTAGIVEALGAAVERVRADGRTVDYRVVSPGADGLRQPVGVLDCGNSGTSLRLFSGIIAGLPLTATLDGDASLRGRPVARIIEPLRAMGATLHGRNGDSLPPVTIKGHSPLRAIAYRTPVPSAQVKSAILLAALRASGRTEVTEAVATRDHTERMLRARGIPVDRAVDADGSVTIGLDGGARVRAIDDRVPGDVSAAAFWLVAGSVHPDSAIRLHDVGVNPTRRAVIDLLKRMGARVDERAAPSAGADDTGEPLATLTVRSSELQAIDVSPTEVAGAIDEIPILCLAATQARGTSRFRAAGELRHKESDRLAGIADGLRSLGADIRIDGDDIVVDGPTSLTGATTDSLGDHRLAMTFAIAGLIATGGTSVARSASASVSYPGFFDELERIRA
jgi:3-phosphoshikimate 1-carboxyvinyltransferase